MENNERQMMRKRRSTNFFAGRKMSFSRSHGQRGATVDVLRGNKGADFEGEAKVYRGDRAIGLFECICLGRSSEPVKVRYVLVKGHSVFVFKNENSPAPKYAIDLAHMTISCRRDVVYIESALGDVEYKFKFDTRRNALLPNEFLAALQEDAEIANTDEIKKELGHPLLQPSLRPSVHYANAVAEEKVKNQPEKPGNVAADIIGGGIGEY